MNINTYDITNISEITVDKKIIAIETRTIMHPTYNCKWVVEGMVLENQTFVGFVSDSPEIGFIVIEE